MVIICALMSFNTQPPEGGWFLLRRGGRCGFFVSTHSRPKAAGFPSSYLPTGESVSTHSRPKAAGVVAVFMGLI